MPGFSSSYSPLFLFLFLIISAAASYWFYRNSPLPKAKQYLLIIIKTIGLFLLLILFIEPVLSSLAETDDELLDIVLVDNSRSNELLRKSDELKRIIENSGILTSGINVFAFSNNTNKLKNIDSINFNGYETSLSDALSELKAAYPDRSFNSITVISDGIFNAGSNPLYEAKTFQAPFITIALGDSLQQKDILLRSVDYNEKAFIDQHAIIKANVNSYFGNALTVKVSLYREGSLTAIKSAEFDGRNDAQREVEFSITESAPGKIRYRVETEFIDAELTRKNNYKDFFITFIDNKVNLLVISGGPGYDNEFAGSVLKRIGNYNLTYKTARNQSEFYEGGIDEQIFPELSAVLFLNYPATQSAANVVGDIVSKIRQHNIPLIFFAGRNTDYQKTNSFEDMLPFGLGRPNTSETQFSMQIVNSDDNPLSKITGINSAPQIFRNVSGIQSKPGSVVLATDKASGEPVIITRNIGKIKSTAFLGYGLWRWRLNKAGDMGKLIENFIPETVNMSVQKEKKSRFTVYPSKDVFDYSEEPIVFAEVFDENYVPTRNAKVSGIIKDKNGNKTADLKFEVFENRFVARTRALPAGEYYIEANCDFNGTFLSGANNRFLVDSLNIEFAETKTNAAALRELSENTSGRVIGTDEAEDIVKIIKGIKNPLLSEDKKERESRFNLWENKYVLLIIILLFAAEWVLRKRNNLA
jgi:hypothetical protein